MSNPMPRVDGLAHLLERITDGICLRFETPGQEPVELLTGSKASDDGATVTGRTFDPESKGYGDWDGPEATVTLTDDTIVRYI